MVSGNAWNMPSVGMVCNARCIMMPRFREAMAAAPAAPCWWFAAVRFLIAVVDGLFPAPTASDAAWSQENMKQNVWKLERRVQ